MATTKVTTGGITDATIATADIADNAITAAKLASGVQTTINNNADNRVITGSGTANTLNAESSMIIDSAGNVCVGGNPEGFEFQVTDASGAAVIRAKDGANNKVCDLIANSTGGLVRTIGAYPLVLNTNQQERMRIDSSGRVQIGTDVGWGSNCKLHVSDTSSNCFITISAAADGNSVLAFSDTAASVRGALDYDHAGDFLGIKTAGSEAMRIDSSGNVGIGTSSPNSFTNYTTLTINGGSDGAGIDLELSDNNIYGRFFADTTGLQIQTAQSGDSIRFETNGGNVRARITDDGLCFGSDSAAANALDDYEEGNWTPNVNQGASSVTYSEQYGRYVKVGKMVTLSCRMRWSGTAEDAAIKVGGLPFTSASGNGNNYTSGGITYWSVAVNYKEFDPYIGQGHNFISFYRVGTGDNIKMSGNTSNSFIGLSAVFFV